MPGGTPDTHATCTPDTAWAAFRATPRLIPTVPPSVGFDVMYWFTTSQQWFTCVRLPDPHLSSHARCVPNASRPALLMSAARVVLKPAPDSRLRRTSRHLLYSLLRRTVSRPGELHPPAPRRTVREPLDSYRSHQANHLSADKWLCLHPYLLLESPVGHGQDHPTSPLRSALVRGNGPLGERPSWFRPRARPRCLDAGRGRGRVTARSQPSRRSAGAGGRRWRAIISRPAWRTRSSGTSRSSVIACALGRQPGKSLNRCLRATCSIG